MKPSEIIDEDPFEVILSLWGLDGIGCFDIRDNHQQISEVWKILCQ